MQLLQGDGGATEPRVLRRGHHVYDLRQRHGGHQSSLDLKLTSAQSLGQSKAQLLPTIPDAVSMYKYFRVFISSSAQSFRALLFSYSSSTLTRIQHGAAAGGVVMIY